MDYSKLSEAEIKDIFSRCDRYMTQHYSQNPKAILQELADSCENSENKDIYGEGKIISDFEKDIAKLLHKESAVFLPSGTMAQPIALRVWCDRAKNKNFGLHPTSHLERHEQHAYKHLHALNGVLLGDAKEVLNLKSLEANKERLAALIIELPHRDLGGELPLWKDLVTMSEWCHKNNIHFHLDGARLWESGPFYNKTYAEICDLFDSVYVSFYKGLGGIAGAILAGPEYFIKDAKIWQRRQGGNLVSLYPYVISARLGLSNRLHKMNAYHKKALELAQALQEIPSVSVVPYPPHTNMMHLFLRGDLKKMEQGFIKIAVEKGIGIFRKIYPVEGENYGKVEFTVGDATLDFSAKEITDLLREAISHE